MLDAPELKERVAQAAQALLDLSEDPGVDGVGIQECLESTIPSKVS